MAEQKYFEYVAQSGETVRRATITATDERMVRAILREQGMTPIEIKRVKARVEEEEASFGAPGGLYGREKKRSYYYIAIPTDGGENVHGEIIASNDREARQQLRERGLIPSKVEIKRLWHDLMMAGKVSTVAEIRAHARESSRPATFGRRVALLLNRRIGLKDMLFYASQLATMNEAGLSFAQSMDILSGLITNQRLRIIHEVVRQQVMEGVSLADAYRNFENELPRIFIELITVGEASGNLEHTLNRMVTYMEKQLEIQGKIRSAMTYPLIMIGLITAIVLGLTIFVVPTFVQLFDSFKVEVPVTTRMLLGFSWFVTHHWYLLPVPPVGIFLLWKGVLATKFGRQFYDLWEYRFPIFGKLVYKITISRILHNLALFLNCGITILSAIELTQQSIGNAYTSIKLEGIRVGVSQGMRLSSLFEGTELFPPMVNYLLIAGEESGSIDELLERGAKYVDQEVDASIKTLTSAIEPMLTVVVAGVVLFVVGSLYLPLVGLMKGGAGGAGGM
ncbi:MAG TPA: type II secretion system F family protein [Pantanalinema sp.]